MLEAKLGAVTAQQELADLVGSPVGTSSPTTSLPLTADPPLVGAYRTYFETLYAGRISPPRLRLIDRTLPIRREAIETHVAAVQAAASAVHAADEARTAGKADLQSLLYCQAELSRQRRAFLAAVRDYNLDIGEYALTVAEPSVPTDRVIGMLIRLKPLRAARKRPVAPGNRAINHTPISRQSAVGTRIAARHSASPGNESDRRNHSIIPLDSGYNPRRPDDSRRSAGQPEFANDRHALDHRPAGRQHEPIRPGPAGREVMSNDE